MKEFLRKKRKALFLKHYKLFTITKLYPKKKNKQDYCKKCLNKGSKKSIK